MDLRLDRSRLVVLVFVGLAIDWAAPLRASDPAGMVVDAAGKPVPGVVVSAIGRNWADPSVSASATTGPEGRFVLPGAWKLPDLDLRYVGVFAQAPDGRCGWKGTIWRHDPASGDLSIALGEVADVPVRLVDQDGKSLPDIDVTLRTLDRSDPEKSVYDELVLPAALAARFRSRSDREGRVVLKGIPKVVRLSVQVDDPTVGRPAVSWDPSKVTTLTLDRRLGEIGGRLVVPDGRELSGKLAVGLRRMPAADGVKLSTGGYYFTLNRSADAAKDGRFRFTGLPPGGYFVDLEFDPEVPYAGSLRQAVVLEPGKPAKPVEIRLTRLPLVTGRVVDEATGNGIAEVSLIAYGLQGNSLRYGRRAKTDATGRFSVAVQPGMTIIQADSPPKAYLGMYQDQCPRQEVKQDVTWPDLKLARAGTIEGRVLDAEGKPVPGAEVRITVPGVSGFGSDDPAQLAGADGSYRLEQIDPTDRMSIHARSEHAATEGPVVIRPSGLTPPGKLDLVVAPRFAARLTGRVVDQRGKPVPNAPVSIWWNHLYYSEKVNKGMGLGSLLDQARTGPDGRFRTRPLWPGDRYHVTVDLKPYAKAETPQVSLSAGQSQDVGTIALVESTATLAGIVVGSDGKPIAGAEVFNRGDSPQPVSTRTGPDGRFRLEGLFAASKFAFARRDGFRHGRLADALKIAQRKYVFARKEGYRFAGIAVEGEPESLTLRMLRNDESSPPLREPDRPTFAAERDFALKTLVRLWDGREELHLEQSAWQLALLMARADASRAEAWGKEAGGRLDFFQKAAAEAIAETDVDAAIALLKRTGNLDPGFLLGWAARLEEQDPQAARRMATEAAALARPLKSPAERAWNLARAGALLASLGRVDEGRPLVEEAVRTVEPLGVERMDGYARGIVAGALARFDSKRALTLIEPIKEKNERERYIGFIVSGLARSDAAEALAMLGRLGTDSSLPQSLKTEIAYHLAARSPDEAVRLAEGMTTGHGAEKYQAEALGWLAVVIASKDRARAFTLIDRALSLPIDKPDVFGSWTYFGGGLASATRIALNARKIGYPDMESVLMRVMAARPDGRHGFNDPAMQAQCQTIASPLVALLNPVAAATILGHLEARSGLSPADLANVTGEWWLAAWALADLKHAEGVVEAQLEAMKASKNTDQALRGLSKMIEILLTSPNRREEKLRREIGASWQPGTANPD